MALKHFRTTSSIEETLNGVPISKETHVKSSTLKIEAEPYYVKLYLENIGKLLEIQHGGIRVVAELLKYMDYNNEISLPTGRKKDICKALGIFSREGDNVPAIKVIDQYLFRMVRVGILTRKSTGVYLANPYLFGLGKWTDIKEIRLQVKYNDKGSFLMTEIKKSKLSQ